MKKSESKPPGIAEYMLKLMTPDNFGKSGPGDFEEVYRTIYSENGALKAIAWYWTQVMLSMPIFVKDTIRGNSMMIKNYVKTAVRIMQKQKVFSIINVAGLSVGMASFLLIALYLQHELSYDSYHEDADTIYRIGFEWQNSPFDGNNRYAVSPTPLGIVAREEIPEVLSGTRLSASESVYLSNGDNNIQVDNFFWVEEEIFDLFTLPLLAGEASGIFADPMSIVISEETAERIFGGEQPIGKTLRFGDQLRWGTRNENVPDFFTVTGVFRNLPSNSHFTFNAMAPFQAMEMVQGRNLSLWTESSYYTYVKLRSGTDKEVVETKLADVVRKYAANKDHKFFLQKLTDIHLYSKLKFELSSNSDIKYVYLMTSLSFLILIIACINYMNLATSRSVKRGREVGVRKVVGAHRKQLVKQFFGESLIVTVLSLLFSILFVKLSLPYFNAFVGRELSINIFLNPQFILWIGALIALVSLLAGSYPALYLSSFRPIEVLKGKLLSGARGAFMRNTLVVFQFSVSVVLIICTLVVKDQLHFIQNVDPGYTREHILTTNLRDVELRGKTEPIKQELLKNPNIIGVSASRFFPHDTRSSTTEFTWEGKDNAVNIVIYNGGVDYDYLEVFGLQVIEGRGFSNAIGSDDVGYLLSESAVKAMGLKNPVGKEFGRGTGQSGKGRIIGIMKDFNNLSLYQELVPMALYIAPENQKRNLSIKLSGNDLQGTIAYINTTLESFSDRYPFEFTFFDELFDTVYKEDRKIGELFSAFAFLAIFVACLGLFGLASFTTEQKTSEIGVRKVLGAQTANIIRLLSTEFMRWVIIANSIAIPAAYYIMSQWLTRFAYRTDLDITLFVTATGISVFIALATVSFQTVKASFINPVHALRSE